MRISTITNWAYGVTVGLTLLSGGAFILSARSADHERQAVVESQALDELSERLTMAAEQMLWLMQTHLGLSADDAYSLSSVAMDLGVTQVVDGTVGCHAGIRRDVFI